MVKRFLVIILFAFIAKQGLSESVVSGNSKNVLNISSIGPRTESVDFSEYQQIFYVSLTNGSDKTGNGSQQQPWKTLTYALSVLKNGCQSRKYAVLVASGTYDAGTIIMKEYVDIYGGFSPRSWKRDIFKYATILDGCRVRRVVVGANHSRIDGFTITRGLARSHGGGIICDDTSPIISNNFITDNFVLEPKDFNYHRIHQEGGNGGGIACLYNALPTIRNNVIFRNKTSVGCGGGIAFFGWARKAGMPDPVIKNNRIKGGDRALVENNVIIDNIAGINDIHRTRSSNGGGISCAYEARPIIRNNIIAGNRAKGLSDAGGIYCEYFSYPTIVGNWIVGNICDDDGGGIYTMRLGEPILGNNIIAGNFSMNGGVGGIRLSKEGRACIINNLIVYNQSGGGVRCVDSYMKLEDNIIMRNKGGGALTYAMRFSYFMPSVVRNNIMRENDGKAIVILKNAGQPLVVENNNIEGGCKGKGNFDKKTDFLVDGINGKIKSTRFDSLHYTTILVSGRQIGKAMQLTGRILHLGKKWGVIKTVQKRHIVVWGDLSCPVKKEIEFEIIPSYRTM